MGVEKYISIAQYINDNKNAQEVFKLGLIKLKHINSLAELQSFVEVISPRIQRIEKIIKDGCLSDTDRDIFSYMSSKEIEPCLKFIEEHPEIMQKRLIDPLDLKSSTLAKSETLAKALEATLPTVTDFLSQTRLKFQQHGYITANAGEKTSSTTIASVIKNADEDLRPLALDILSFPQIQKLMLAKESLPLNSLVPIWQNPSKKAAFIAAISDDNVFEELQKQNGIFSGTDVATKLDKLINVGEVISHPKILPLIEFGLLDSRDIWKDKKIQNAFSPEDIDKIAIDAKYNFLKSLKAEVDKKEWSTKGWGGVIAPTGIKALRTLLSDIPMDANNISAMMHSAQRILNEKQAEYIGAGTRQNETITFYEEQYTNCRIFDIAKPNEDINISIAEIYCANKQFDKAAEFYHRMDITNVKAADTALGSISNLIASAEPDAVKLAKDVLKIMISHEYTYKDDKFKADCKTLLVTWINHMKQKENFIAREYLTNRKLKHS